MSRENEQQDNTCPVCYEAELVDRSGDYRIKVKDGKSVKEITVKSIHWRECQKCGEVFFDDVTAQVIEAERYKALGLLTPVELRTIRQELGLTQSGMAEFLKVGSKSYCRWENGLLMQSKSMDNLIRYAYDERRDEKRRSQRVKRATQYLAQVRASGPGSGKSDLALAAHSKNVSSDQLKEVGKKIFRKE
jgi:putative zinc finger/helix-turn-helix YgiT family protein